MGQVFFALSQGRCRQGLFNREHGGSALIQLLQQIGNGAADETGYACFVERLPCEFGILAERGAKQNSLFKRISHVNGRLVNRPVVNVLLVNGRLSLLRFGSAWARRSRSRGIASEPDRYGYRPA